MSSRQNLGRKNSDNAAAISEKRLSRMEKTLRQIPGRFGSARSASSGGGTTGGSGSSTKRYARINWDFDTTDGHDKSIGIEFRDGNPGNPALRTIWIDWASSCRPEVFGDAIYEVELMASSATRDSITHSLFRAIRCFSRAGSSDVTSVTIKSAASIPAANQYVAEIAVATTDLGTKQRVPVTWDPLGSSDSDVAPYYRSIRSYATGYPLNEVLGVFNPPVWRDDGAMLSLRGLTASAQAYQANASFLQGYPIVPSADPFGIGGMVTPSDKDVLTFDNANGRWKYGQVISLLPTITPGSVGDSTHTSTIIYNAQGLITGAATSAVALLPAPLTNTKGDYIRYDGSVWSAYNLGDLAYNATTKRLYIGGGSNADNNSYGLGPTQFGVKNRFLLDYTASLEFIVRGSEVLATDKWARILTTPGTSPSNLSFQDDGTEVMLWTCSATPSSRRFDMKMPLYVSTLLGLLDLGGTHYLKLQADLVNNDQWNLSDPSVTYFVFDGHSATKSLWLQCPVSMQGQKLYGSLVPAGPYLWYNGTRFEVFTNADKLLVTGDIDVSGIYKAGGVSGVSHTVTLVKLTAGGANGSIQFTGGIATSITDPT